MATNIFNDSASVNIGPRLTNVKNQTINSSKMLVYDSNQRVSQIDFNTSITPIFNQNSLDALKTLLLDNTEEAIVYTANSSDIIEFHTGLAGGAPSASNLRMVIDNTDTKLTTNLLVDNIEDQAGNSAIKFTTANNTTFSKQTNTFQFTDNPNTGYIAIHNSNSSQSAYMQWYSYDATGAGSYPRNAYMGLSSTANSGINDDLKLSLENNVNFNILKGSTSVMKFDNVNNKIVVTNPIDVANLRDVVGNQHINLNLNKTSFSKELYSTYPARTFTLQGGSTNSVLYQFNSLNLGYNIVYDSLFNNNTGKEEPIVAANQHTAKISLGNNFIKLQISDSINIMPTDVLGLTNTAITCSKPLKTQHIIPDIATSTAPDFVTSIYDLGQDTRRWRDIFSKNSPTHGSDIRLKTDIKPLDFNSLDTILKLEPVLFKWKANESSRNHIGFIAQQIEKIPELANTGYYCKSRDGSTMSLRSAELIPVLVGGIQTLNDKHDKLKELINELLDKHQDLFKQIQEDDPFENLKLLISENNIDKPVGDNELPKLNKEKLIDLERKIQILDDSKDEYKSSELTILKEDLEQLCESKDALEQELFKFKTQNDILEQRIIELENIDYHQQPVEPAPAVDNNELVLLKNRIEILEEQNLLNDSESTHNSQIDIIMSRLNLLESENKKLKNKVAKQTTIINKLITK